MLSHLSLDLLGHHAHQDVRDSGVASHVCRKSHVLDALEEQRNPRVVRRLVETPKGLAKGEVADHVKRGEVEPGHHIDRLRPIRTLVQLLEQRVDVRLDDGLLVQHRLRREAVGHDPAEAGVVLSIGADDVGPVHELEHGILAVLDSALLAMAPDLVPRIGMVEGQRVRRNAHDRAILLMQLENLLVSMSRKIHPGVRDPSYRP